MTYYNRLRVHQSSQRFEIRDSKTKTFVAGFYDKVFDTHTCDNALSVAKKVNPDAALFRIDS